MDEESPACDQLLTIVNRKREYIVSKKFICSSVPYFEKMFCCDLLESKENKVELDFDEYAFDSILNWVYSGSFVIKMDYLISFYDAADYLMINERLCKPCVSYFHENFTIKHIPSVLNQVSEVSRLITLGSIESIICRHFLMIAKTNAFLRYPFETIEAILKMDLMIHSEYQVFESIMRWVNKHADTRKDSLPDLLNCVRWTFIDSIELSKIKNCEMIKTLPNFNHIISCNDVSALNRDNQRVFVSIQQLKDLKLQLKQVDKDLFCLPIGDFTRDDSMSLEFVHEEHISDILFDSGTKGIRVDWSKKTFRWLDFKSKGKNYYRQLLSFIIKIPHINSFSCCLEDKDFKVFPFEIAEEKIFLESDGLFIVIGKTKVEKKWFGSFSTSNSTWINNYADHQRSFQATVLDDTVYILTKDLEFIQFNIESRSFNKSHPFKGEKWNLKDLVLTSHPRNDDKVLLVNKLSGVIHFFCTKRYKWLSKQSYHIMNVNFEGLSVYNCGLIAFTSTFLPTKHTNPLFTRKICDNLCKDLKRPQAIEIRTSNRVKKPKIY